MRVFQDAGGKSAHDAFQQWRTNNARAFVINCGREPMLHCCRCPHFGTTDWSDSMGSSLTTNKKICAANAQELVTWARKQKITLADCSYCASRIQHQVKPK